MLFGVLEHAIGGIGYHGVNRAWLPLLEPIVTVCLIQLSVDSPRGETLHRLHPLAKILVHMFWTVKPRPATPSRTASAPPPCRRPGGRCRSRRTCWGPRAA